MRRVAVTMAVLLACAVCGPSALAAPADAARSAAPIGAIVDPALQSRLAAAGSGEMVSAIVVLRAQAVLNVTASTRRGRLAAVELALRAVASATQQPLLDQLAVRQDQGSVADVEPLWIFNGIAVTATPEVIAELAARPEVRQIRADLRFQAPHVTPSETAAASGTEANLTKVNAPAMWNLGYRGQGIVVANMDTGVDVTHPDLASRWRGGTNSWYDPNGQHPTTPTDVSGHGTWTMGVMVGGDAGGTSIGVAPDARWIAVKIFNDQGTATSSRIHLGFQWLLDPDGNPSTADAPNVVNNSWTMSNGGCNLDFQLDLQNLRSAGILPVFAAGNTGPSAGSSLSPANNPEAFAVGAIDSSDVVNPSSSRGPSSCGQPVYPQLAAPGVGIRTSDLYGSYVYQTGTSIAAPHVSGALALLLNASANLSADQQASALQSGAMDLGVAGADNTYGYGRLDVLAAYQSLAGAPDFSLTTTPTSSSTAAGGDASFTISAANANGFTDDVTLSLSGLSGSQATWSFTPPVIAGGSGTSQLTVTTSPSLAPGSYPLTITGTSGPIVRTTGATLVVSSLPDFVMSMTPASQSVVAGASTTFSVGVASLGGFTGDVSLSLAGLPSSVGSSTFAPPVVPGGAGSSQLTVTTSSSAPSGTYPLTVVGTSGSTMHTVSATLVVSAAPDFAISIAPSSVTVKRGKSASYAVTISALHGFTGNVALSVGGLPTGATASFSPNPVTSSGVSTLTVRTSGRTPRGTFTLTITGASGTLIHGVTTSLTVS